MSDEPKITVDDLLKRGPSSRLDARITAAQRHWQDEIFGTVWPERPTRRRFDPRRLTDCFRRMPAPIVPPRAGKIVYSTARPEDLYASGKVPRVAVDMATRPAVVYYGAGEAIQSRGEAEQAAWWLARLARDEGER